VAAEPPGVPLRQVVQREDIETEGALAVHGDATGTLVALLGLAGPFHAIDYSQFREEIEGAALPSLSRTVARPPIVPV